MRYSPLSRETYIHHRQGLTARMEPGTIALFNSNDVMPTSGDGTRSFVQDSDLYYLTGVDQEETMLLVFPDAPKDAQKEILFLRETNDEIAIWEGDRLTKEQARDLTGIQNIKWLKEFEDTLKSVVFQAEKIYLNSNEHLRNSGEVETREERFGKWIRAEYPLHNFDRVAPIMHRIRSEKTHEEIEQMRNACMITEAGFRKILEVVKPGMKEYELEAEYARQFLSRGSRGFAYEPIVAGGFNACVLHYVDNHDELRNGDLILMDVGCEYGNYASDMTRTIPVNGRYSDRQKQVYNAVLRVQREAMKLLKPGVYLGEYHKQVGQLMEKELVNLNLITNEDIKSQDPSWPAYKKYFMHGTSHFIGLDTHDVGHMHEPLPENAALTVEPGIYIREENLGIRIENDIIISKNGIDDLMGSIPIEIEEIEELMNKT